MAGALKLRLEYRGDFTQDPFFTDSDGQRRTRSTRSWSASSTRSAERSEGTRMTDLAMIAITFVFFLLAWLYVRACERV